MYNDDNKIVKNENRCFQKIGKYLNTVESINKAEFHSDMIRNISGN